MDIEFREFFEHLLEAAHTALAEKNGEVIKINITKEIPGSVDLSSLTRNALYVVENNVEEWIGLSVEVFLRRHFKKIVVDNSFPSKLSLIDVHGDSVTVRESTMRAGSEKKIDLYFFTSWLVELNVEGSIGLFDSDHLSVESFKIANDRSAAVHIEDLDLQGNVDQFFIHNTLVEKARIDLLGTVGKAEVINVNFHYFNPGQLYMSSHKMINLACEGGKSEQFALILHSDAGSIVMQNTDHEHFNLEQKQGKITSLALKRVSALKTLTITGHNHDGQANRIDDLYLHSINFTKDFVGVFEYFQVRKAVTFYDVVNQGAIRFSDVDLGNADLRIGKSRIGNFSFFSSKLSKKIYVEASNLEDIRFAGTLVPTQILGLNTKTSNKAKLTNQIQVVQQMKTVMEKTGDKDLSKYFRQQELRLTYEKLGFFNKKEFEEKLTLWFNFSNAHGQSWIKPLLIALAASGPIIFSLFVFTIGYRLDFSAKSFQTFSDLWGHYFDVIIPSYVYPAKNKLAFLEAFLGQEKNELWKLPFSAQMLVLLNDVLIMPFLIIQTVTAFRKHVA
ncbi:hypothetical protein SAMN05216327_11259 [Dyadobacter sp. SG02]|uniref:hypothetical protein n=1 Tax=Dyadobacter sp. SG02 TaxID=1855291 RepID=UPI0008AED616|nr:hypothetical protein [Dyadobacter sp. SG02]SEJ53214.1 hypothetical protein SAMN05216327_11259 [Dyadobacter sp. SG02]